ncbi:MAG: orotidine-5'-phosphate decarboxylase [Gammaproteobacteria bacterium]
MNSSRVVVPLDFPDQEQALALCQQLPPDQCKLKIGKELFTRAGPALVTTLIDSGYDIFLDLKYHDIPNTVAQACKAAAELGVWMLNVHACGGKQMLQAAREAIDSSSKQPLLIAVTVLTSMNEEELTEIGVTRSLPDQVMHLASMTKDAGLDGVVCSAREAAQLKQNFGPEFCLVTPGIRPASAAKDDQKRIMTPAEAIKAGSHYLVIGRPITRAEDPGAALAAINAEISSSL